MAVIIQQEECSRYLMRCLKNLNNLEENYYYPAV